MDGAEPEGRIRRGRPPLARRAQLRRAVRLDAHGLVTIEDDQRAAQRVAAGDFAWQDAPEKWQRSLRELAVAIEADWPALGLSH